jgi:putative FmdB family regulatory protein
MPIYDYRCTACGRMIEVMHSISDTGPEACGECGGAMRKALSTPAIHFKGSGWAKKDAAAATAGKAKAKSDSGSSAKESGEKGSDKGSASSAEGSGSGSDASKTKAKAKTKTTPQTNASSD